MRKILVSGLILVALLFATAQVVRGNDKVTICHAAGQAGTTKYVTLNISENAVYGPAGHFNENGTPQAGHEEDYLGPCKTPSSSPSPSSTIVPSAEPTESNSPEPSESVTPSESPSIVPSTEPSMTPSLVPSLSPTPSVNVPNMTPPPTDTETDKAVAFAANAVGVWIVFSIFFGIVGLLAFLFILKRMKSL